MSLTVNVSINSLRICISLKETFYNSITFTVINRYGKGVVVEISTVFGPVYDVAREKAL